MKKLNNKGFTLIELLAVIVILGVIMLIAIPSVSKIIANSRENTYKSSAQTLISGARNMALSTSTGKPDLGASNTPWVRVDVSKIDATKMASTNNFDANNYLSVGYAIKVRDIDVESGSNKQSAYNQTLNENYSYVIALENKNDDKLEYFIQLHDNTGNTIKLINETALDQSDIVEFDITATTLLSIDAIKSTTTE